MQLILVGKTTICYEKRLYTVLELNQVHGYCGLMWIRIDRFYIKNSNIELTIAKSLISDVYFNSRKKYVEQRIEASIDNHILCLIKSHFWVNHEITCSKKFHLTIVKKNDDSTFFRAKLNWKFSLWFHT